MKQKTHSASLLIILIVLLTLRLIPQQPEWAANGMDTQAEQAITAFCREHDLSPADYPAELVELLERNPETEEFVLHYPLEKHQDICVDLSGYGTDTVPLFLQWDRQWGYMDYGGKCAALTACGPVCLSMAAYYLTGDDAFSPDSMIEFAARGGYYVSGSGSKWTLISEGAAELGFEVEELPLVKSRILQNLEEGWPVICAMGKGDFTTTGHYIVLVGVEDGALRVNDPNSLANSEKLWKFEEIEDQFRNLWVIRK